MHIVQRPDASRATFRRATANSQRGKKSTQTQQEVILQAAKALEALNPTDSPATSPLINGRWSLLYQGGTPRTGRRQRLSQTSAHINTRWNSMGEASSWHHTGLCHRARGGDQEGGASRGPRY
jgi:PAP_fibrillin